VQCTVCKGKGYHASPWAGRQATNMILMSDDTFGKVRYWEISKQGSRNLFFFEDVKDEGFFVFLLHALEPEGVELRESSRFAFFSSSRAVHRNHLPSRGHLLLQNGLRMGAPTRPSPHQEITVSGSEGLAQRSPQLAVTKHRKSERRCRFSTVAAPPHILPLRDIQYE